MIFASDCENDHHHIDHSLMLIKKVLKIRLTGSWLVYPVYDSPTWRIIKKNQHWTLYLLLLWKMCVRFWKIGIRTLCLRDFAKLVGSQFLFKPCKFNSNFGNNELISEYLFQEFGVSDFLIVIINFPSGFEHRLASHIASSDKSQCDYIQENQRKALGSLATIGSKRMVGVLRTASAQTRKKLI